MSNLESARQLSYFKALGMPEWFISPEEQKIVHLRLSGEFGWKLNKSDFPPVYPEPGSLPGMVPFYVVRLPKIWNEISGLARTVLDYWEVYKPAEGFRKFLWEAISFDKKDFCLIDGMDYRPGIYLEWINLKAFQGKSIDSAIPNNDSKIKPSKNYPIDVHGIELAALMPQYFSFLNSRPSIAMAGIKCRVGGEWRPLIIDNDPIERRVRLIACKAELSHERLSSPIVEY